MSRRSKGRRLRSRAWRRNWGRGASPPSQATYFLHAMFVPVDPNTPSPPAAVEQDAASEVVASLAGGRHRLAFAKQGPVAFRMLAPK